MLGAVSANGAACFEVKSSRAYFLSIQIEELCPQSGVLATKLFRAENQDMPLYRAYLIENGHVWTAVDLSCADDDDAKQQTESLLNERDIELWQGDRRVAVLNRMRRGST
jgi:hypothetical protein